ncbi:MAG: biotin carboxylase N-terminal domain-containing protein [Armatimonadota bacterium]|nr:biotin carboxylase N-terminal domain-containing protein [Armatimonadota bacterium]MDR5697067.1 biotin carboxylase N-terminal domain-containing protein [Armatimonadota bacterium]
MPTRRIGRVLVANRGEIAVRVIRTCRELGIGTVAIYSDADARAPHVHMADAACRIGPPPAADSYLRIDAIVEAARRSGADAVHPGYGFLAENPLLAEACAAAGLVFIGPGAPTLRLCGDKAAARERARAAGVPLLEGTDPVGDAEAAAAAERLGYPVLIKAAAGGGGKGIHVVRAPEELASALRLARGEALSAFGDDRVYLERCLERARHVEVQILADAHGNVVALGERDCSIQRRHQKVIEETPCPVLAQQTRRRLFDAAVRAVRAVGYTNAGTVEFLYDPSREAFFFLEINARLQVEHPVTEMVTGLDLVAEQIRIAAGAPMGVQASEEGSVATRGAAIECRIAAEDVEAHFLPSLGRITALREPAGPWVRTDAGWYVGMEVTRHYDPMLAKVVVWAPDRPTAIARMTRALAETVVSGVQTTIPFHLWTLQDASFRSGRYDVRFVEERWTHRRRPADHLEEAMLAAAAYAFAQRRRTGVARHEPSTLDAWRAVVRDRS